jgi:DNA-binding beta-propeller fold protein YncE
LIFLLFGCDRFPHPDAVWLETGNGPAQTVYPRAIAYSPTDDSFFICDRQARIQHLDRKGRFIAEWQTPKWAQGKPVGLTVGPDGNLYVPDTHYHRVLVYKPTGEGPIREWGSRGTGPGEFIYPTDIAFDSTGRIFVAEYGDHDRIQVFNAGGKYLYEFGSFGDGPGQFSRPQSILIDGDLLYVTDACNHRICVFKTDGTFVQNFGGVGSGLGQFRFPYGLAMDSQKNLIVCEFGNNRVQKIDSKTGKGIAAWGQAGRDPGQLAYPWGVAVDKHDRVVAVDAGNNRLQVFEF